MDKGKQLEEALENVTGGVGFIGKLEKPEVLGKEQLTASEGGMKKEELAASGSAINSNKSKFVPIPY